VATSNINNELKELAPHSDDFVENNKDISFYKKFHSPHVASGENGLDNAALAAIFMPKPVLIW
jgi:hypothetical protein